jgi:hypothetical protein
VDIAFSIFIQQPVRFSYAAPMKIASNGMPPLPGLNVAGQFSRDLRPRLKYAAAPRLKFIAVD